MILPKNIISLKYICKKMNSNKLNKKKYENNMFDFQAHMTFDKNFGPNFSNFDKESKKTFTKFIWICQFFHK